MAIKRITTNLIKDSDIATVDIANNAITAAKITDGNITTAKLADLGVTAGKLAGTLDLTGKTITVATATTGDSDTSPASTAFVQQEIAALVDSSPSSLNTLNELAAALGDDASFSTTVTDSIATKLPLAGGTMTGNLKVGATIASTGGTTNNRGMLLAHQNNTNQSYVGRSENGVADTGNRITFDYDNDKMQLDSDGDIILTPTSNVGIGTTSPRTQTHILGTGQLTANITDAGSQGGTLTLSQNSNSAGSGGALLFAALNDAGNYKPQVGIKSLLANGTGQGVGALAFSTRASASATELTERMRIVSTGNVGIGDTSPDNKVNIQESSLSGRSASNSNTSLTLEHATDTGIQFFSATQTQLRFGDAASTGAGSIIYEHGTNKLRLNTGAITAFETGGNERMQINARGALVFTPSTGVEVNNSIVAHTNNYMYMFGNTSGLILQNNTAGDTRIRIEDGNTMRFETSSLERMRIDSSGNVGIGGNASPAQALEVYRNSSSGSAGGYSALSLRNDHSSGYMALQFHEGGTLRGDILFQNGTDAMQFRVGGGGTERMRIDSSGNLLVGNTVVNPVSGFASQRGFGYEASTGKVEIATDANAAVMELGKNNANDGSILVFRKQSNVVGSIGANSSDIYIASTGTYSAGLMFEGSSGAQDIRPCSSTGALLDAAVDLGDSSARFKDLYLSGGVHLGGTGAANKLDDYEEGTFDPTLTTDSGSVTMYTSYNTLAYTKVGRVVTITGMLALTSVSSPTGQIIFGNLPFTMANLTNRAAQTRPTIHIYASGSGAPTQNQYFPAFIAFNEGSTSGLIVATYASASDTTIANWFAAGSDIFANFSYITA